MEQILFKTVALSTLALSCIGLVFNTVMAAPVTPVKASSAATNLSGKLIGQDFAFRHATYNDKTITIEGGNLSASDPAKGVSKVVIQFPSNQKFGTETYRVPYNGKRALLTRGDILAPEVTYTTVDKSGAPLTRTAVNNSKADELDYAMELTVAPSAKPNQLSCHLRLQIGTDPVSDLKGDFTAIR
jgi:hypothetical protein